jgi:mRNA interferase RelE/StbE
VGSRRFASSVADETSPYGLVVAGPAARSIAEVLPEPVAAAVIDLITGDLLDAPERMGKPLRRELEGAWVARRGTFRVVYDIDHDHREVVVLRVDHRRDVYRRR